MNHTIFARRLSDRGIVKRFGFEIQPPLLPASEKSVSPADQLASALSHPVSSSSSDVRTERPVQEAWVTRNDEEGTIIIAHGNLAARPTEELIAEHIASLIDPMGTRDIAITVIPRDPEGSYFN